MVLSAYLDILNYHSNGLRITNYLLFITSLRGGNKLNIFVQSRTKKDVEN